MGPNVLRVENKRLMGEIDRLRWDLKHVRYLPLRRMILSIIGAKVVKLELQGVYLKGGIQAWLKKS